METPLIFFPPFQNYLGPFCLSLKLLQLSGFIDMLIRTIANEFNND